MDYINLIKSLWIGRFKSLCPFRIMIKDMGRWSSEETKFPVKIQYNDRRGCQITIPRPIVEKLDSPEIIVFEIKKNGNISVNVDLESTK